MVVYWGMLIWVFLIGYFQPDEHNPIRSNEAKAYRAKWILAVALMLPVTFFAAVRGSVNDTGLYIQIFKSLPDDMMYFDDWAKTASDSRLFYGLSVIWKCYISDDPMLWLALIAVIEGVLVMLPLRRYSPNMAMSVYIFMASTLFTWMYNGIRQLLVVVILFALSECIIKNRWYIYLPVVLVLSGVEPIAEIFGISEVPWYLGGIHQSALLMIPVFFIVQGKAWNWKMLLGVLLFVILAITGMLTPLLESTAENTGYAEDIEYFGEYGDDGANPLRAVVAAVPVLMALMKKRDIDNMDDVPPIIPLSVNMSLLTTGLYVASTLTNSGVLVGRMPMYAELYSLILIPWLILHPFKRDMKLLSFGVYGAYLLWFIYQMYIGWGGLAYTSDLLGMHYW